MKGQKYLVQCLHDDGTIECSMEWPRTIIEFFGFRDCTNCEYQVYDTSVFGQMLKVEHEPSTFAPFNYHKFVNPRTGEVVFDGYSTEH